MTRNLLHTLAVMAMMLQAVTALAVEDEIVLAVPVEAKVAVTQDLALTAEIEYRTQEDVTMPNRFSVGAGAIYTLAPWLNMDGGYLLMHRYNAEKTQADVKTSGHWTPRHRLYAGFNGTLKLGKLSFVLRERYQYLYVAPRTLHQYDYTLHQQHDVKDASVVEHLLRSRLMLKYNVPSLHLTAYTSAELHNELNHRMKYYQYEGNAGAIIQLSDMHNLKLEYTFKSFPEPTTPKVHMFTFGYGFTL